MRAPATKLDRASIGRMLAEAFRPNATALAFATIASRLRPPARPFVFGGVLRNAVLSTVTTKSFRIRDVDYVVFGLGSDEELYDAFVTEQPRRNSFGGLKMTIDGVSIDIWRSELEEIIAGCPPRSAEPEEFLHCVTLTVDAALYDPGTGTLHEQGFVEAFRDRRIDVGRASRWVTPWVPYHLAHLAYVRQLTGFRLSERAAARVRAAANEAVVESALRYLEAKGACERPRETLTVLLAEVRAAGVGAWKRS